MRSNMSRLQEYLEAVKEKPIEFKEIKGIDLYNIVSEKFNNDGFTCSNEYSSEKVYSIIVYKKDAANNAADAFKNNKYFLYITLNPYSRLSRQNIMMKINKNSKIESLSLDSISEFKKLINRMSDN